jgi:putative IMPACT (imprinted ancient) family translation regulator
LLTVAHEFENDVFKLIKQLQLKVIQHQHEDEVLVLIEVRKGKVSELKQAIKDLPHINMTFHK